MRDMLKLWIDDAADTTKRIKGDVAHLREIGRQAKLAAKVATGIAKRKFEKLAEYVAELEQLRGPRGRTRTGAR